jgi:ribonuclease HI
MTSVFIMKYLSVFTDGGSRGNPGTAAFGVVIRDKEAILHAFGQTIGIATNNIAEYSGILEALAWIYGNREAIGEISGIDVYMDSQLACRQLTGTYRIKKPHLAEFLTKIREVEKKLSIPIHYHHIPRERNKEAEMPYRILCNGVQREGAKLSPALASELFCYVPLHKIRYGVEADRMVNEALDNS